MRHLSLFSGIGGFDLAAEWMGWENVAQVEKDPWCQRVLEKNFPKTDKYLTVEKFIDEATRYTSTINVLTGGFPCQPSSTAGNRLGKKDPRFLWPTMFGICKVVRPDFIVGENVAGLLSLDGGLTLESIFLDLEFIGYTVEPFLIPSAGVGAWHRRDRIWILAYSKLIRRLRPEHKGEILQWDEQTCRKINASLNAAIPPNPQRERCQEQRKTGIFKSNPIVPTIGRGNKSRVGRGVHGVPHRVDRIKGLGNAIDPHIAFEIFKAIEATNQLEP